MPGPERVPLKLRALRAGFRMAGSRPYWQDATPRACFSEHTPGTEGPRRVAQEEIRAAFAPGFEVLEIAAATFATRVPDFQPHAWRAALRRT